MAARKMVKTNTPGIYKRGVGTWSCGSTAGASTRNRRRTLADAREAKARKGSGESRPVDARALRGLRARVARLLRRAHEARAVDRTRRLYRRDVEGWAIPYFLRYRLSEVGPPEIARSSATWRTRG